MDKQKMYIRNVKINVDNRAKAIDVEIGEIESPGWLEKEIWSLVINGILEALDIMKLDKEERKKLLKRLKEEIQVEVKEALDEMKDDKANNR